MPPVDRSRDHADDDSDDLDARPRHHHHASKKLASPLQRGSACLSCRKRKMKCDATKPVCRQCVKANRAEECEYDDGRQKSRTQILQEKIAKLEDRIRELEQPGDELGVGGYPDALGLDPGDDGSGINSVLAHHDAALQMPFDDAQLSSAFAGGAGSGNDLGLAFDGSSIFGHALQHSPSVSATGSGSSATYSPLSLGAPGPLPQSSTSSFDATTASSSSSAALPSSTLTPNTGIFDPSAHFAANSPGPSVFFGLGGAPSPPGSSSGSARGAGAAGSASGEGSRAGSRQHSNRSSWQPDIFATLSNENSLTGSPFPPVDVTYATTTSSNSNGGAASWAAPTGSPGGGYFTYGHGTHPGAHGVAQLTQASLNLRASSHLQQQQQRHWWEAKDMAPQNRKMLFDIFLPHARQCGLHNHVGRLQARLGLTSSSWPGAGSSYAPSPPLSPHSMHYAQHSAAHPALANAIYLLACHFSGNPSSKSIPSSSLSSSSSPSLTTTSTTTTTTSIPNLTNLEDHFLTRTLRGIASALEAGEAEQEQLVRHPSAPVFASPDYSGTRGTPLVDAVQASALLAVYFFAKARLLEGYYHASAAARLAVALGMHQIKSPVWRPPQGVATSSSLQNSPDPSGSNGNIAGSSSSSSSSSGMMMMTGFDPLSMPMPVSTNAGAWSGAPVASSSSSSSSYPGTPPGTGAGSPRPSVPLPPARSSLELQERVSAFWQVFCVDRCWSVATGLPSSLPDDDHPQLRICTVWPWAVGEQMTMETADYTSLSALYDLSSPLPPNPLLQSNGQQCTNALKSRACAFFERAARLSSLQNDPSQWEQVCQMEFALLRFAATLPGVTACSPSTTSNSTSTSSSAEAGTAGAPSTATGYENVDLLGLGVFQTGVVEMENPLLSSSQASMDLSGLSSAEVPSNVIGNPTDERHNHSNSNSNISANTSSSTSTTTNANSNSVMALALGAVAVADAIDPELVLIHTLVQVATIQLFHPFAQKDANLHAKCLEAARAVTALLRLVLARPDADALVGVFDPIMGTCCMCASDVFVREKMWGKEQMMMTMASSSSSLIKVDDEIDTIVCVLKKLGDTFPVAAYQAQKVESSRNVF